MRTITVAIAASALLAAFISLLPSAPPKQSRPSHPSRVDVAPAASPPLQTAETVRVIQPSPYAQRFREAAPAPPAPEPTSGAQGESLRPAEASSVRATVGANSPERPRAVVSLETEPSAAAPGARPATELYDINSASLEQLNALRDGGRIGRAIIRGRPYRSTEELVQRRILSRATYARIKDQIEVGPPR